jgi:erythromycin esterase-like protein
LKQRDIDQAIGYIQNNPYFDTLENVIKNNLTRAFEIRRFEEMSNMPGYEMRDYLQFQNSKFAIETWCNDSDKVLIYAHLSHVNKKCILDASPETPSLGNYMKQNYGNNYFVTALLAGIGEFISMDSTGNYVIAHLQKPFKGSLEMQFLNLPHQICYKNLSDIKSADYGRYVGAYYIHNQFYPYSHKNRFDALFFIHHNKGFGISDFMAKTAFERFEYIRKLRKLDSF